MSVSSSDDPDTGLRTIHCEKEYGMRVGVHLAAAAKGAVLIREVDSSSLLVNHVHPGDHILSLCGKKHSAADMAKECVRSELVFVIRPSRRPALSVSSLKYAATSKAKGPVAASQRAILEEISRRSIGKPHA